MITATHLTRRQSVILINFSIQTKMRFYPHGEKKTYVKINYFQHEILGFFRFNIAAFRLI